MEYLAFATILPQSICLLFFKCVSSTKLYLYDAEYVVFPTFISFNSNHFVVVVVGWGWGVGGWVVGGVFFHIAAFCTRNDQPSCDKLYNVSPLRRCRLAASPCIEQCLHLGISQPKQPEPGSISTQYDVISTFMCWILRCWYWDGYARCVNKSRLSEHLFWCVKQKIYR